MIITCFWTTLNWYDTFGREIGDSLLRFGTSAFLNLDGPTNFASYYRNLYIVLIKHLVLAKACPNIRSVLCVGCMICISCHC